MQVLRPGAIDPTGRVLSAGSRFVQSGVVTGKTGLTEPSWPTAIGDSVADGDFVWTMATTRITDENCPNSAEVVVMQSKVYASGSHLEIPTSDPDLHIDSVDEADLVRFSAATDPFDWTSPDDAGFLAVGVQASGSEVVRALGKYNNQLVVLMQDNIQLWAVDPDPARNALTQVIGDIGTSLSKTVANIGTELVFLTAAGFRSLGQQEATTNVRDTDIGSPVDVPVQESIDRLAEKQATASLNPEAGQYWCSIGDDLWAWTWSRSAEVQAWARFDHIGAVEYFAPLGVDMYMRDESDALIVADTDAKTDYSGDFDVTIEFSYQSSGSPGGLKQYQGVDVLLDGTAAIAFKYDPRDTLLETSPIQLHGNTRPGYMTPMELCTTDIAPILRYTGQDKLSLDMLTLYFNDLGVI